MAITTPITKPLWPSPQPPTIHTPPPAPLPMPAGAQPHSGRTVIVEPNDRLALTGTPVYRPDLPPENPLPPPERPDLSNARSPITGALLRVRDGNVPPGWEL